MKAATLSRFKKERGLKVLLCRKCKQEIKAGDRVEKRGGAKNKYYHLSCWRTCFPDEVKP